MILWLASGVWAGDEEPAADPLAIPVAPAAEEPAEEPPADGEPPPTEEPPPPPPPPKEDLAGQILEGMDARPEPDDTPPPAATWKLLPGSVRYIGSLPPDLALDDEGTSVGQGPVVHQRVRAGFEASMDVWSLGTEWDLFTGQVAGDVWDIEGSADERGREALDAFTLAGIQPRRLALSGKPAGLMRLDLGLMTSHWGLGMLANGGGGEPRLFGRRDGGDRVIRLAATSAPFRQRLGPQGPAVEPPPLPLYVTVGFDLVVGDDLANWSRGDIAEQGLLAIRYEQDDRVLGTYWVYRGQAQTQDPSLGDVRSTRVFVGDFFAQQPVVLEGWRLKVAAEWAGAFGVTDRVLAYPNATVQQIRAAGGALHGEVAEPGEKAAFFLRGGFASGDTNPDDRVRQSFTFDPNYDVGLVLFPEVKGSLEAASVVRLSDPENAATPPDAVDALATEGAFGSAMYVLPAAEVDPFEWVDLRGGVLMAWATAPIADALETFRAGGTPTNHLGVATDGRYLGTELDLSLGLTWRDRWPVDPRLQLQAGHAWLGSNLGGGTADLVTLTASAAW